MDDDIHLSDAGRRRIAERAAAFARLDLAKAWRTLGVEGDCPATFEADLAEAMSFYSPGPDQKVSLDAKTRTPIYRKLEKTIASLQDQLDEMHDHIVWEIDAASTGVEPEDFEATLPEDYEGLSFGGYHIHLLIDRLATFSDILDEARRVHDKPKGKPKQNETLSDTIKELGYVFKKYTGQEPMTGYRFDDWNGIDDAQVYHGPFFDLLHLVFWSMYGQENPTSHVLGDTARRAFNLRK
ncbi:hypothetical protein [Celeribacter neptunius]|uniref:Uncharacterized protein n=1 Tax=Celeribacter neptunius TaxID=588602 RepID=A0A1I3SAF8_9RHOB|nr:hypothetical protein [Celeribacter neptunius]SFJ54589.1 hypothetical protein SAMN04487991_2360 [Celeribacter neptunius]